MTILANSFICFIAVSLLSLARKFVIAPEIMKLMALVKTCGTVFYNYHMGQGINLGNECFCHLHVNPNADREAPLRKFEAKYSNTEINPE
jgi:hypothetical protein